MSSQLKGYYIEKGFSPDKDAWPPEQPKEYTTLTMIHHKNQPTQESVIALAEAKVTGKVEDIVAATTKSRSSRGINSLQEALCESNSICEISDIFASVDDQHSRTILIEGAPGLGKTVMLKQIAQKWAKKDLLRKTQLLFSLTLQDPAVRNINTINGLVEYFCKLLQIHVNEAKKISEVCSSYIVKTKGENVTILLDGFDELPPEMRQGTYIANIIHHEVLSLSTVVISSRPHASRELHDSCNIACRVDILGCTKKDQEHFFKTSPEGQSGKFDYLMEYLEKHPAISSLCYIPFIMTVLLWLFKYRGNKLPSSSAQLYDHFISHTIYRYLKSDKYLKSDEYRKSDEYHKSGELKAFESIKDIRNLPGKYREVMQQLCCNVPNSYE